MKSVLDKFEEGGPLFTYTIFVIFLVLIGLYIIAALNKGEKSKIKSTINHLGWIALAWGYLGRTFGLILAFDNIAAAGDITPKLMAGGLKMALIGPLMGLVAFIIARLCLLLLTYFGKEKQ